MANCYWITGLSGAGKTTLARMLTENLRSQGRTVILLDGDDLREVMGRTNAHAREERLDLAQSYARLARLIANQGADVVISTISLFHEVHAWNRRNLPGYREIYLDVPLKELKRRDPKGIYAKAAEGEVRNIAGIDFNVDIPRAPDIHLTWRDGMSEDSLFLELLAGLEKA